ncbi:hypothetical protein NFI96_010660 [Prochilodus magdalenae]|nr:hypothetical protein NFI96_010660 [Prochilodus magdalenae]
MLSALWKHESDGQLWCSTETDYTKDKKWGFCPQNGHKNEETSGWDSDPVNWCPLPEETLMSDTDLAPGSCLFAGLTNILGSALWIGLNSLDFESGWQWSNGNPFRYLNWAPGHPSLEPGLNCAALNAGKASKWESMGCSKKLGYICRKGNSTTVTPTVGKDQPSFCPPQWVPYAGHCYSIRRSKMMWRDALAACHKEGSDLASIHNIEEHSFIISQSGYLPSDELWIGLNDQKTQNLFEWSDRTHVTFAKWLVGEPSHTTNFREDCVLMKGKEGKWADHMCEKEHDYMCKSRKPLANLQDHLKSSVLDALFVPETIKQWKTSIFTLRGWIRFSSYCYSIAVEAKTFNEAKTTCGQSAASLVHVADRYENAFLISLVGLRPEKYFWIGLSNTEQAERFKWTNKEAVKFTHFNVGMPDRHQGCVAMLTGTSAGLWDVLSCQSKQKYICKKIAEGITTTKEPPTTQPLSCPPKWTKKGSGSCMRIYKSKSEEKKTWFEARDFCRAIGGDLASFHSESETDALPYGGSSDPAWIGFSSLDANVGFVWTDESPSDYDNWSYGEPNNYNDNEHCAEVSFYYGHRWNDRDCESYNDWVCQIRLGTTPKSPPTGSPKADFNVTDDGWLQFNGSQYFINTDRLSMEDARAYCKKNHSDLIVITGQTERKFIWKQISRNSEDQYYIGMTVGLDKSFSWVDGSPVVYTAWNQNEPNFANNDENCVTIYKSMGFWNDINCGVPLPSVCKRSIDFVTSTVAPTTAPKGGCAPEWISFQGKCYKFVEKGSEKSWHDARQYCISQGGNLVSIRNQAEQAFLTTMMANAHDDMWIGLNDVNREMRFLWTDGKGVVFTNWAKGHPVSIPDGRRSYGADAICKFWTKLKSELSLLQPVDFIQSRWDYDFHRDKRSMWIESESLQFDCVIMVKEPSRMTGLWKVEDCSETRGFVCKRNIDSQIQVPVTTASPKAYSTMGNNSYTLQTEKMSWDEARRQCKADDADLASVLDTVTQALITLRFGRFKEPVWIGLNSNLTSGRYRWVDNWLLRYAKWAAGEPKRNLACVYIDTDGTWKTADCSNTYYSLCKRSPDIAPTEPPQLPGICPEPKRHKTWIPFQGHCYSFMASRSENWAHATVECMRMGASLVSVEDMQEAQFIQANLEILHDDSKSFWIGMHRSHSGEWMWIDNMVVDYTNWAPRLPNTYGDCVEVRSDTGLWFNAHCSGYRAYICKTEKVIPPTEKQPDVAPRMEEAPHGYAGIAVAVVLVIIAVAGLAAFLFFKRPTLPVIGECTFDNTLYFNNPARSGNVVDTKGLVANIEQNEHA